MKNKEIEELLNMLKKCAREEKATLKLNEIACKTILSYIEQLQQDYDFLNEKYDSTIKYNEKLIQYNEEYKLRIDKAIECIEKQKKKMYKSRNKIALFILMKLENILKGDSDERII